MNFFQRFSILKMVKKISFQNLKLGVLLFVAALFFFYVNHKLKIASSYNKETEHSLHFYGKVLRPDTAQVKFLLSSEKYPKPIFLEVGENISIENHLYRFEGGDKDGYAHFSGKKKMRIPIEPFIEKQSCDFEPIFWLGKNRLKTQVDIDVFLDKSNTSFTIESPLTYTKLPNSNNLLSIQDRSLNSVYVAIWDEWGIIPYYKQLIAKKEADIPPDIFVDWKLEQVYSLTKGDLRIKDKIYTIRAGDALFLVDDFWEHRSIPKPHSEEIFICEKFLKKNGIYCLSGKVYSPYRTRVYCLDVYLGEKLPKKLEEI